MCIRMQNIHVYQEYLVLQRFIYMYMYINCIRIENVCTKL